MHFTGTETQHSTGKSPWRSKPETISDSQHLLSNRQKTEGRENRVDLLGKKQNRNKSKSQNVIWQETGASAQQVSGEN